MAESKAAASSRFGLTKFSEAAKRSDVVFALGIMAILTVLILPLPKGLLDVCLALSLMVSMLVLTTALFIEKPLEFSSFPTLLLVSTMLRLSLNVASTRLILGHGHEGLSAAGEVIRAFGAFIMQGNFVIGLIVFSILVLVNFVVITKGSGRIAEVSARFSLDAMPGKQMAVDADLSAGLITEAEAKARRKTLEDESNFFGSMDGAAKFVRGDAIAGLCITFINIIGGIIIGVAQMNVSLSDAVQTYTILTVGDGLVSQIPALIVSTAAGILVSKAGVEGSAEKALFSQLSAYPSALGISSFLMAVLGLLPGIPLIPFMALSFATGAAAWKLTEKKEEERKEALIASDAADDDAHVQNIDPVKEALHIDPIKLEVGYGILPLINGSQGQKLTDQIKSLRAQLAREIGFVLPTVRMQDNLQLPQNKYLIRIKDVEVAQGDLRPHMLLCMNPSGGAIELPGEPTVEPTFGLQAMWISHGQKRDAEEKEYTIVEPLTVITTHISETIKDNTDELLGFTETQALIDDLDKSHQKLFKDMVPSQITMGNVQRVLQNLLSERVSIRDLGTILESISEVSAGMKNVSMITEHVRSRLARQMCAAQSNDDGVVPIITLSPEWENQLQGAIVGEGEHQYLSLQPSKLQELTQRIQSIYDQQAALGVAPVLLTSSIVRPHIRSIVERFRSALVVMSHNEIHPKARIQTVATV
ncbi:MAG: flagellar biosynthesis protein FlhA [Alphaproteobacteria bacterium]|nr:flagellar biosynthesis protein FlhA [Alphaproteobacteria bacterium]NCQ66734.1 flagellar biosynthesis protein FlhA [Alphaproteobacteria bacterium]NCT07185.1 flagellar biosynthesis protein FlhA [Alphaproteobacteria bacterium]